MAKTIKFFARLAVGIALLVYLLHEHEVRILDVLGRALELSPAILLAALLIDLLGQSLSAYRWSRVARLGGQAVSFRAAFPIYFSGMFFNTCLPTSIGGDVVKVIGLGAHTEGRSKTAALATVFMDRNIGLAALLLIGLSSALAVTATVEATFYQVTYLLPLWPLFLALILGYVLANMTLFSRRVFLFIQRHLLRRLPGSWSGKVEKLHLNLQTYRRLRVLSYAWPFSISLLYQISEVTCVWLLARGLGLALPLWVFGALVTFQAVAGLLPVTINNMGVREGLFVAVLLGQAAAAGQGALQIKQTALALSLVYFGVTLCSALAGGLVYLMRGSWLLDPSSWIKSGNPRAAHPKRQELRTKS